MPSTPSAHFLAKGLFCSLLSAATAALFPSTVSAEGTFIPAPNRVDMVADSPRNLLYITSGDSVLRYDLATGAFLPPIVLGGVLKGIDLSPNGDTLLVADQSIAAGKVWVHVVDLVSGTSRKALVAPYSLESGTYTVAFGNDGNALVSSTFAGSGSVPLRQYSPTLDQWTQISTINMNSMLTASGDGSIVGVAESNSSGGPFDRYRVSDGNFLRKWPSGTGWYNFEIGTNHNGTQFALPTYGGTFIYDATLNKTATLGTYAGRLPIGVVYHPVENIVYFAWTQGQEVIAHDTTTFATLRTFNVEHTFGWTGNWAFQQGRLRISRDGSQLFATVAGGVRFLQQYASLEASPASVVTAEDAALPIALNASIGNGGTLGYSILAEPEHGTLSGTASNLVYTPDPEFSGTDEFTFAADYGQAGAQATISITVTPVNDVPAVSNQTVALAEDTAKNVTLTAVDPDNAQLSYVIVDAPSHGTLTGSAPNLTYTPAADYYGADSFSFQANDGTANSQVAVVSLTVAAINDPPVAAGGMLTTSEDTAAPVALAASDIDSSNLSFNIVTGPAHGALTGVAPNLVYTPAANYSGSDSFGYQVNDGEASGNVATVSITVSAINDAPVAVANSATTRKNTAVNLAVLANDSDVDGGALVITSATQGSKGTTAIINSGTAIRYTPNRNVTGTDTFTYSISDGQGGTATATVTVAIVK